YLLTVPSALHSFPTRRSSDLILGTFFKTNQPSGSKIIHRLDNNANYQHAVIELTTSEGAFRVSYSIRVNNNQTQLVEIRIAKSNNRKSTRLNSSHVKISYAVF